MILLKLERVIFIKDKVFLQRNWFKKESLFLLKKLLCTRFIEISLKLKLINLIFIDRGNKISLNLEEVLWSEKWEKVAKTKYKLWNYSEVKNVMKI